MTKPTINLLKSRNMLIAFFILFIFSFSNILIAQTTGSICNIEANCNGNNIPVEVCNTGTDVHLLSSEQDGTLNVAIEMMRGSWSCPNSNSSHTGQVAFKIYYADGNFLEEGNTGTGGSAGFPVTRNVSLQCISKLQDVLIEFSGTGDYSFTTSFVPADHNDVYEPNNSTSEATEISLGQGIEATVNFGFDNVDYYQWISSDSASYALKCLSAVRCTALKVYLNGSLITNLNLSETTYTYESINVGDVLLIEVSKKISCSLDGVCKEYSFELLKTSGCTDPESHNFDPSVTFNDGTCKNCSDGIQNGDEKGIDCGGTLCEPCVSCDHPDLDALVALYNSTNGPNWIYNAGWNAGAEGTNCDPCSWPGIYCENNRVVELLLNDNNLSGYLPPQISDLTFLRYLNLSSNSIDSLPEEIGQLVNLNHLDLSENNLDFIPLGLANLDQLQVLILSSNNISVLQSELTQLSSLNQLILNDNEITSIPIEIENLDNLQTLELNTNNIDIIPLSISGLVNLESLDLSENSISSIPAEVGALTELVSLRISNNNISNIPTEIENLLSLQVLELNLNPISELPDGIGGFLGLEFLDISYTNITCFPSGMFELCNISFSNVLSDGNPQLGSWEDFCNNEIPSCNSSSTCFDDYIALKAFYESTNGDLWSNNTGWDVSSSTPPADCDFSNWFGLTTNEDGRVVEIDMYNNNVDGKLPAEIGLLSELYTLNLNSNSVSGIIPSTIEDLDELRYFYLLDNLISGSIPVEFAEMENLSRIYLGDNNLSGNIPEALGNCPQLTYLYLYDNELNGEIPEQLWNLDLMIRMYLHNNELEGSIPEGIEALTNLVTLQLQGNNFIGSIPSSLGLLPSIAILNLNDNNFSGCLAPELMDLCGINILDLRDYPYVGNSELADWNLFCDTGACAIIGCTTEGAHNYNPDATLDSGDCITCDDGILNGDEELIDCGGTVCDPCFSGCRPLEYEALKALYESTDGDNWTNNDGWDVSNSTAPMDCDFSNWYGIEVDVYGSVTHIRLQSNNLSGTIPAELGNLSDLYRLQLNANNLSGEIPAELGLLENARYVLLSNNALSGSIPNTLGNLLQVRRLYLSANDLVGTIPAELGNLPNVTNLYLHNNNLTGEIPIELSFLKELVRLYLHKNELTGTIPSVLGKLENLTSLRLKTNQLSGELPFQIGNLPNLQYLELNDNNFSGCFPSSYSNLCEINFFDLNKAYIGNEELADWNLFCDIDVCEVLGCTTIGAHNYNPAATVDNGDCITCDDGILNGDEELIDCGGVLCLPCFNGCRPLEYQALKALYESTDGDNWTNNDGWNVSSPTEPVDCDFSNWYGIQVDDYGAVTHIRLQSNNLTGTIPSELSDLTELYRLQLNANNLSGEIPPELGLLENARYVLLSNNALSGSIPSTLGNLTEVRRLYLFANDLDGIIPSELGNLSNVTNLYLHNNNLTGEIPFSLGELSMLNRLYLHKNELSGMIPESLGLLENLVTLRLKNNLLSGVLPESIGSLPNLDYLELNKNDLEGCIPNSYDALCDITFLDLRDEYMRNDNLADWNIFCDSGEGTCVVESKSLAGKKFKDDNFDNASEFSVVIFPNPFPETVNISLISDLDGKAEVRIYNLMGQNIHHQKVSVMQGEQLIDLNLSELFSGIYFIEIQLDNNHSYSQRIIKIDY